MVSVNQVIEKLVDRGSLDREQATNVPEKTRTMIRTMLEFLSTGTVNETAAIDAMTDMAMSGIEIAGIEGFQAISHFVDEVGIVCRELLGEIDPLEPSEN
jgi:polyhydroxyalkanoate synthesis regulator phasin